MFLYVYVDILNFYKPGVIDGIHNGLVWQFDISPTLLTVFLVSVSIPAAMVILSMTLPARANRATNLVVATLLIPYSIFNAAGASWDWAAFYGISIGLEVLLLGFILRSARRWPRTAPTPTDTAGANPLQVRR
jgi:phage shock protein PspC (stress-responsive transcriptional regulator)